MAIITVLVVLGGVTAGLIWAMEQQAPRPAPTAPTEALVPPPEATPGAKAQDMPTPTPMPERTTKPEPLTETREEKEASSEPESGGQGTVYTWHDGNRTRRVVLETHPAVQETEVAASATEDGVIKQEDLDSIVRENPQRGGEVQPVFRSESGGELMTLQGGVVLALDPEWDRAAVESFFLRNGIALKQTSELDFLDNGFFVETEPGFPSLELANALAGQEGVILSSPNWSREVELK